MQDLAQTKKQIASMAALALAMWRLTHQAFMEHNLDLLAVVLEKEQTLNSLERQITGDLVEISKGPLGEPGRVQALGYIDVVEDLELIGDYCKDILERVQIKIEEKLLFSEDAVKEYNDLYQKTEVLLDEVTCALERDNPGVLKEALSNGTHLDKVIDEYRQRHKQRLIAGVCSPLGCNMFLNMLDFTAAVYYHAKKIAKIIPTILHV